MRLLILGGTVFLGRHLTEAALARGHEVTHFNRGRSGPDLFATVETLRGDRDGGLESLRGREWDVVIDPSGFVPRIVRMSAELLAGAAARYVFVSSLSVFADFKTPGMHEGSPVARLEDPEVEEITPESYGGLKALCEEEVLRIFPGRALVIRPGLIVGPHDPSNRFTYWPRRVARGGEVLAPSRPDYPVQLIDARDLAQWMIGLAELRATGTFNATGPREPLAMSAILEACRAASGSDARFTWASDAQLLEAGVTPWMELPLWIPESQGAGFSRFDVSRAVSAGLRFRPIEETARETLAWARTLPEGWGKPAGLAEEKERTILAALATG